MLRKAQRPLTGNLRAYGEPDVRFGPHADGGPAVTVDLRGFNDTRTFADPGKLTALAAELTEAAQWLTEAQMFGPQSDDEADAAEAERMSAAGWSLGPDGWEP